MHFGSVPIDSGSGLGAEVAVLGIEIVCTDAVFAADTLEPYSTFDPIGGVVSHAVIVGPLLRRKGALRWAVEGNLRSPLSMSVMAIFRQLTRPVAASTIKLARGDAPLRTDTDLEVWIGLLGLGFVVLRCVFECLRLCQQSVRFSEKCISLALKNSGAVT